MECNKDEACRAKELAVEKMVRNDFEGARKIALKAKQLFPELDNISQIIAVCDVHCSAQKKIFGAVKDLYGIIQVENLADETTIRKQYRKLALVLHPDKNRFPGAEAAFKLIGEAHMTLSDKQKRSVYDVKCRESTKTYVTKVQKSQGNQTSNAGQEKFNGVNHVQHVQHSKSNQNVRLSFWTSCPFCKIKYEYSIEYVKRPLRCQQCSKLFIAYDIGPQGGVRPGFVNEKWSANLGSKPVSQQKGAKREKVKVDKKEGVTKSNVNVQKPVSQQKEAGKCEKVKVNKQEGFTKSNVSVQKPVETGTAKDMNKKRGRKTGDTVNESSYDKSEAPGGRVSGGLGGNSVSQRRSTRQKEHVFYREDNDDEFSPQKRSKPMKSSDGVEDTKKEPQSTNSADISMSNGKHKVKAEEAVPPVNLSESDSDSEPELVDCPDQDFFNFDKNKEEHCFSVDQIWACYDSIDGMPRFYAQIKKVYSSGFKLRFTWLESEPEDDHEIRWTEEGLPVACGKFVIGETEETRDRLMFSHQIAYSMKGGSKSSYVISPQKGEIWALYKDWDINWSLDSENHKKFKFDIVEILSVHADCTSVAVLLKVKGFVSVFQRGVDEHVILSNERFRFSHRVPSAKLTGTERAGVPTGSVELDMASLPSDFEDYCYYYNSQSHEEKVKPTIGLANTSKKYVNGHDNDLHKLRRSPRGLKSPKVGPVNDGQGSSSAGEPQVGHNFSSDRQISKFQVGQIWAFWESFNGSRQRYAQVKQIEYQSCKLHVSLLNKPCSGYSYSSCGLFKVSPGKPKVLEAGLFSHIVKAEACGNKMFNIHPKEKQIWALFKSQAVGECEIVEVVETGAVGIKVMTLTRVPGFKSVFKASRTQDSTEKVMVIPRVELNRFSSQIPAFLLTEDCLCGYWELDPAALTGLHLLEPNLC